MPLLVSGLGIKKQKDPELGLERADRVIRGVTGSAGRVIEWRNW